MGVGNVDNGGVVGLGFDMVGDVVGWVVGDVGEVRVSNVDIGGRLTLMSVVLGSGSTSLGLMMTGLVMLARVFL